MKIGEIIVDYLKNNKFDGLFNVDGDCACDMEETGLCPCDESIMNCEPGYKTPCPPGCDDHNFHISKEKP